MNHVKVLGFFNVLLCCIAYCHARVTTCRELTICVTSKTQDMCHRQAAQVIRNMSAVPQNCNRVLIYLTSGGHYLNRTLNFTRTKVAHLEIHGVPSEDPSTILCSNAGIAFKKINVTMTDVVFDNCGLLQKITYEEDMKFVALYAEKALTTLRNVTVMNTVGIGLYAYSGNVTVTDCKFLHNSEGHMKVVFLGQEKDTYFSVSVFKTSFCNGTSMNGSGGLEVYTPNVHVHLKVNLCRCEFEANDGQDGSHLMIKVKDNVSAAFNFTDCTFSEGKGSNGTYGVLLQSERNKKNNIIAILRRCNFTNNHIGGLKVIQLHSIEVSNSSINSNAGTGIEIQKRAYQRKLVTVISSTLFHNNSRALYLNLTLADNTTSQSTLITACNFTNHNLSLVSSPSASVHIDGNKYYAGIKIFETGYLGNRIRVLKSKFSKNHNVDFNCSTLLVSHMDNVLLEDLSFSDNKCTGITLVATKVKVQGLLDLVGNSALEGGGLQLLGSPVPIKGQVEKHPVKFSVITLNLNSQLSIVNNTADRYGGGVYTDKNCEERNCFFQLENASTLWRAIRFIGNRADLGGDAVFGSCLSNCSLNTSASTTRRVEITKQNNVVWDIISSEDLLSRSTFATKPTRVAFCTPENPFQNVLNSSACSTSRVMNAYAGQLFNVSLMVADDLCSPSIDLIKAKLQDADNSAAQLEEGQLYQKSSKYCSSYSYSITGQQDRIAVTIQLTPATEASPGQSPTLLTVHLQGCPIGWENREGACVCSEVLRKHGVECLTPSYSLKVPVLTWIGEIEGRGIAVSKYCTYNCKRNRNQIIQDIVKESDLLCNRKQTGVLCGACISSHSLQLGGYKCAICSASAYKGVLLVLGFMVIGVAMVLLLLSLNLTVSTGLINGLIFYSNIVHLNSEAFLPIESNKLHLNNAVKFLSTFQAWMNLDFGIVTCFFDGYDKYISTWMQFVFPLYIWLLILTIVLASRYSNRISKITTSNTVSVLATLLLLSYAKLSKTSIEAASFTDAEFLNGSPKYRVWILDGNIPYLQGKHIPLFLMSLVTIVAYILPFTLLILLGPVLQAKSHYGFLSWINKLKPILDSFYGPYTSRYRYWPGILLLARLIILGTYAFYSLGDSPFKLVTVSVIIAVLLVTWILIGKTQSTSLHQKKLLDYLELFFLLNLMIFAVASIYHTQVTKNTQNQQGLAVGMVGSVFVSFCIILVYQIFCIILRWRAIRKIVHFIPAKIKRKDALRKDESVTSSPLSQVETEPTVSTSPTHSSVEMAQFSDTNNKLREPLLTD